MHAIIERTANFVCKQGAQFEIMLKAKQARNSQFDFLRFDHYLNPYYKFIQRAMKEGRYTVPAERKGEEKSTCLLAPAVVLPEARAWSGLAAEPTGPLKCRARFLTELGGAAWMQGRGRCQEGDPCCLPASARSPLRQ